MEPWVEMDMKFGRKLSLTLLGERRRRVGGHPSSSNSLHALPVKDVGSMMNERGFVVDDVTGVIMGVSRRMDLELVESEINDMTRRERKWKMVMGTRL